MDEDDAEELIDEMLGLPEPVIRERLAALDSDAKEAVIIALVLRIARNEGHDVAMEFIQGMLRKLQPH